MQSKICLAHPIHRQQAEEMKFWKAFQLVAEKGLLHDVYEVFLEREEHFPHQQSHHEQLQLRHHQKGLSITTSFVEGSDS